MFGSIRFRITGVATVVVAVVFVVTGIVLLRVQESQLLGSLDTSLAQYSSAVEAALDLGDQSTAFAAGQDDDRFVQLALATGELLGASANVRGMAVAVDPGEPGFSTVGTLPIEDDTYRVMVRPIGNGQVLVVAENTDDVNDAVRILGWSLALSLPLVLVLLAALIWWLVGRTLRPVHSISAEVSEIRATQLDRRVPVPSAGDEITVLATTMNEMLDRIEESSVRQRSLVADASHELRIPLTRLRAGLEVELAAADPDLRTTAEQALVEVAGLQNLVNDLLQLARSDETAPVREHAPVDLDDIVLREARHLRETTALQVDTTGVSGAHLSGDAASLLRVVRNLVDNAARHAESTVWLSVRELGHNIQFVVEDDGPGRASEDLERIFERFTRFDEARTNQDGGAGLGLAIVRAIAIQHGGTARAELRDPHGLRLVVELDAS